MRDLKNDLPVLAKKLSKVYGFEIRLVGPYVAKRSGRKTVDVKPRSSNDIHHPLCKTVQLARVRLEIKLGRPLRKHETVDHKNGDCTDDSYSNLQPLTLAQNSAKGSVVGKQNAAMACRTKENRVRNSLRSSGELNSQSKLTNAEVKQLRLRFKLERDFTKALKVSGLKTKALVNVLEGKSYTSAGGPVFTRKPRKRGRPKRS